MILPDSWHPNRTTPLVRVRLTRSLSLSAETPYRHIRLPRTQPCRRTESPQLGGSGRLVGGQLRSVPQPPQLAPSFSLL